MQRVSWISAFILSAFVLASCGGNPILGSWQVDADQSDGMAAAGQAISEFFGADTEIEFLDDTMIRGGKSQAVTYDVQKDRVIVTTGDDEATVFTVIDADHISTKNAGGTLVLTRVGAEPTVAAEPPPE